MLRRRSKFLEGDRAAILTLRAAAKGVIDFSRTDLHSPTWWKNWRYLTGVIDTEDRGELLCRAYEFQLALISNARLAESDNFTAAQKRAKDIFYDLEGNLRPWLGRTKAERDVREKEQYREQWIAHFGFDPDDPEARHAWEEQLSRSVDDTQTRREETEAKDKNAVASFNSRVEEIRLKRLRQQGRI